MAECRAGIFFICDELLVRKYVCLTDEMSETVSQIVVPKTYRDRVLQTAHEDGAGHFGVRKTYNSIFTGRGLSVMWQNLLELVIPVN